MSLDLPPLDARLVLRGALGQGGMGEVYRAWDARLERAVAVKLVRGQDERDAGRLLLEARLQARVEHPHVVKVHEVGTLGGRPCIVMQLVEGRTLAGLAGNVAVGELVELVRQAAAGLHAAHLQGLVHRDVKPGNVLVEEPHGGPRTALVADFGLARGESSGLTRTGLPAGTLDFMSPEQIVGPGPVDFRSDVYALGATLYALLAGRPPFRIPSAEGEADVRLVRRLLEEDPPPLHQVSRQLPPELSAIAAKAMEKDPAVRYPSAEALGEDLARFQRGEPVRARLATRGERVRKWARRNPAAARAVVLAASVLVLAGAWTAWRARRENLRELETSRLAAVAQAMADGMRMEYLGPPHDIRPARTRLRSQLEALRPVAESGRPAASLVMGKGLELLGDLEGSRVAYERAWAGGLRTPAVAEGLGWVLARLYLRDAESAARSLKADEKGSRLRELREQRAEPARRYLDLGDAEGWHRPFLQARIALLDGDFDGARRLAREVVEADPGRYEARALEGEAWIREGVRLRDVERRVADAEAAFRRAAPVLEEALVWGRSDPGLVAQIAKAHGLVADALQRRALDPDAPAKLALSWADRASAIDPEAVLPWLVRGNALESMAHQAQQARPADFFPLLEQAAAAHRKAIALDPRDAESRISLAYNSYARGFHLLWAGQPALPVVEEGLRAASEAAAIAPGDFRIVHRALLLRMIQAESLQHKGLDATEALRAAVVLGEDLLRRDDIGAAIPKLSLAQVYLLMAKEDWSGARDPRPSVARSIRLAEEAKAGMPGQIDADMRLAVSLGQGSEVLLAMGENPRVELARCLEVIRGAGRSFAKSDLARLMEGMAFSIEARRRLQAGEDPRPAAEAAERILAAAKEFRQRRDVQEYLSQAPLYAAAWAVQHGEDPAAPLGRARSYFAALLRNEPRNGVALSGQAATALQRALWLRRRGRPFAQAARQGLSPAARALEVDARDPVRWVLQARLQAASGDPEGARRSLAHAVSVNPLVRSNPDARAAEAELSGS